VQQGEFIDFVFLFIHQTKLSVIQYILQASNPHGVTNLTVRGFFYGNCISSNTEASEVAET